VTEPDAPDLIRFLAALVAVSYAGNVWRGHRQIYPADSDHGSRLSSGRYHKGPDCRALAQASIERDAEAVLVPSATRRGDNVIIFTDNLHPGSTIQPTGEFFDPRFSREIP
jgi:hypothetical protein